LITEIIDLVSVKSVFFAEMSLFVTSLNSGSNGNCYYISNGEDAVLIDAGISCRETERRLQRLGLSMNKVRAIFISHEHSDHINGLKVLSKKYKLPVYITEPTHKHTRLALDEGRVRYFRNSDKILIGAMSVTAFLKRHDAADPHSFIIECDEIRVGVFTDIGSVCDQLTDYFRQCHAAFLEANYDDDMLDRGAYPYHLKRRIRGGLGHLSNTQALALFRDHKPDYMTHLFLAHLSRDNNDPRLVQDLFDGYASGTHIIVASRYQETSLFEITGTHISRKLPVTTGQLALF